MHYHSLATFPPAKIVITNIGNSHSNLDIYKRNDQTVLSMEMLMSFMCGIVEWLMNLPGIHTFCF